MICKDVIMNHTRWQRPKRNVKTLLVALLLTLVCGSLLLGWMPESAAAEVRNEAVDAQNEAVDAQNEAVDAQKEAVESRNEVGEVQSEAGEASATAEEEKGTFDSIKGVFSSWGHKAGIQKDKLSVKYDMRKLRGKIEEDYQELGRVFFRLYRDGAPDIMNDPELKEVLGAVVEKKAELEKLDARLAELRAEGGEDSEEEAGEEPEDTGSAAEEKPAE